MGNTVQSARLLSAPWRENLTSSLKIIFRFELYHPMFDPWPPGAVEYSATFTVSWDRDDARVASPDEARILDGLARGAINEEGGHLTIRVGTAEFVVADLYSPSLLEALASRNSNLSDIAGVLLDRETGELADDLLEQVEGIGEDLIIVQDVSIAEPWRGLNLGLLGTGLSLQHLSRASSAIAALHPLEPGLSDAQARGKAHQSLGTYWGRLGFRSFRDEIYVLDLARVDLGESMNALTGKSLGL